MAIEPIKGFYVHDEKTNTDGVAKYSADSLANLDDTVSLVGYAPDAKAVGDRLTATEGTANHADELAETLNKGGLELKDSVIEGQVDTWLDDHPEATTTVQDGAITKAKINTEFLPEIENAYVTPEMFGAVGDGTTDDTAAFQDMLGYCYNTGALSVLGSKTYLVDPLVFDVEGFQYVEGFTMIGTSKDKSILQLSESGWFSNPGTRQLFNAAKFGRVWFKGYNGHGYGFYQYSTGMGKQLKFSQCRFNLDGIIYTAGTGNADINTFNECRSETNEYVVTNDNAQSVGTVLINCGGSLHGDLIRVKKGGCTELYGCAFDFYDGDGGYVINAENNEGLGLGNLDYNIYASRFEMRAGVFGAFKGAENVDIKVMFNGCNFGVSGEATPNFCDVKSANSVTFDNCVLNSNYTYNISGTNHHGVGALLNISNSVIGNATGTPLIERINNTGTTSRVISRNNYYLTGYNSAKSVSNDFDLGWQNIAHNSVIPATVKVMSFKKVGDYWPMNNGSYNVTIHPPIGAKLKSVVIDIPQNSSSGYTCTLKITNAAKTITYFESQPFVFNDGFHVDTKILKDIESELLMSMTTAEGKNFAGEVGNAYIEYI